MDELINRRRVEAITGLSRSTIYSKLAAGTFPKPLKVGMRAVRWRKSSIVEWMDNLPYRLLLRWCSTVLFISRSLQSEYRANQSSPSA